MKMRPLEIDDAFKAECLRLREFAENPKHWYLFGKTDMVPGDNPEYVLTTGFGFRAVFTITYAPGHSPLPFRHMTVSVPGEDFPNPVIVYTIAHLLGFTGAVVVDGVAKEPGPWGVAIDEDDHCITVQQPYRVPNVS